MAKNRVPLFRRRLWGFSHEKPAFSFNACLWRKTGSHFFAADYGVFRMKSPLFLLTPAYDEKPGPTFSPQAMGLFA
jgi:hypothetical protein